MWLSYTVATFACIFLLLGLFGNGMTLAVTLKSETRFKPHNILIMSLAVADILSLVHAINTLNVKALVNCRCLNHRTFMPVSCITRAHEFRLSTRH